MADTKVTALAEYNALPAADDLLYIIDVSDTTDDPAGSNFKMKAQRLAVTDGNLVTFTGGGTVALAGFTLTAEATGTIADKDGVQTFTNKTLTTPTIGSFTNAQHTHIDAAGGGTAHFHNHINIFSDYSTGLVTADTSYNTDHISRTTFWINKTNMGASTTVKLNAWLTGTATATVSMELYNFTTGAAVAGSTITHNTGTETLKTSGDFFAGLAAGANRYYIRLKSDTGESISGNGISITIDH
jgi:hypothetical protein